jgi:hypothetical protein
MFLKTTFSWRHFQRWTIVLSILCLHLVVLRIFISNSQHRPIDAVRYLSIFNVAPIEQLPTQLNKPQKFIRNEIRTTTIRKVHVPDTSTSRPTPQITSALPSTANPDAAPRLNLDMLRGQAVQIERNRTKSDIEKMNDGKRLDLTLETTFGKEVSRIELPECRRLLLGKSMPERMMIIQDHSKKKFCRSSM